MKTIVVVEDDKHILQALTIRLEAQDYKVIGAIDAARGTTDTVKHQPDLLILDISMPGGDGFDVARRVRSNTKVGDVPIIFITANDDPTLKEKATQYNAAHFFHKPYDANDLVEAVNNILH